MADVDRVRRLRWLCRRGMKELDLLLLRFVDRHETELAAGGWPQAETLLAMEDDVLWDWLQDPARAGDEALRALLESIRDE